MMSASDEEVPRVKSFQKTEEEKWLEKVEEVKKRSNFENKSKLQSEQRKEEEPRRERQKILEKEKENIFVRAKLEVRNAFLIIRLKLST